MDWLRIIVHVGALIPLGAILWDSYQYNLTANPIQELTIRTGKAALVLLVLSLACTPASSLLRFRPALRVRRALGLYGFLYAALHVGVFVVLDYGIDLGQIAQVIAEKYYIIAGLSAFLILIPLALTSTRGWMRWLGQRWKALHRLVYLAVPLAVLHFALAVKSLGSRPEPLLFGAAVAGLLVARLWAKRRGRGPHQAHPSAPRTRSSDSPVNRTASSTDMARTA
jgi:sulfoxide reductase heme-binding subunit YedZ